MAKQRTNSRVSAWLLASGLGLGFACGESSDPPAGESGPPACVGGQYCVGGLECVNGFCVDPSETGDENPTGDGDDTPTTGDGDGDPPGDGDGDPPGDGDGDPPGDGDGDPPGDGDGDPPPDFAADGSCDIWLQNCPANQKCAPFANGGTQWNDTHCVPITGDQGLGEPCDYSDPFDGVDDCAAGYQCWFFDNQFLDGTCVANCEGTPQNASCPGDARCLSYNMQAYFLCIPDCNMLTQDCPHNDGCYPSNGIPQCFSDGDQAEGTVCQYVNSCLPGLACFNASALSGCGGQYCCTSSCNIDNPSCSAPEECIPYYDQGDAPAGLENVGFCLLP